MAIVEPARGLLLTSLVHSRKFHPKSHERPISNPSSLFNRIHSEHDVAHLSQFDETQRCRLAAAGNLAPTAGSHAGPRIRRRLHTGIRYPDPPVRRSGACASAQPARHPGRKLRGHASATSPDRPLCAHGGVALSIRVSTTFRGTHASARITACSRFPGGWSDGLCPAGVGACRRSSGPVHDLHSDWYVAANSGPCQGGKRRLKHPLSSHLVPPIQLSPVICALDELNSRLMYLHGDACLNLEVLLRIS